MKVNVNICADLMLVTRDANSLQNSMPFGGQRFTIPIYQQKMPELWAPGRRKRPSIASILFIGYVFLDGKGQLSVNWESQTTNPNQQLTIS